MKVIVIGSNGQLGSDLLITLGTFSQVFGLTHDQIEISNIDSVSKAISELKPDIVINTAAYHNVPECEKNPLTSFEINAVGALNLARVCADKKIQLVHYSTDYVFDGEKKVPYLETDNANPLNIYGSSKLAGEQLIRVYSENHIIIRVSGIYGKVPCRAKGGNFIYNILKAAKQKPEIRVVDDEILSPTSTEDIAKNTLMMLRHGCTGLFHMTCEGACSWYEFTEVIFKTLKIITPLSKISSFDFPAPVKRPLYSVLENHNLNLLRLNHMPDWKDSLIDFLNKYFIS